MISDSMAMRILCFGEEQYMNMNMNKYQDNLDVNEGEKRTEGIHLRLNANGARSHTVFRTGHP